MNTKNNSSPVQHGEPAGYPHVQHGDDEKRYFPTLRGHGVATRTTLDRAMAEAGPDGGVFVGPDGRHLGVLRDRGDSERNDLVRPFDVERGDEPTDVISVGWVS